MTGAQPFVIECNLGEGTSKMDSGSWAARHGLGLCPLKSAETVMVTDGSYSA